MKVGDKVVCISGEWVQYQTHKKLTGPKAGDIVTICNVSEKFNLTFLSFKEWPCNNFGANPIYQNIYFRPVDYTYGTEVCEAIETEFTKLKEPIPA